MDQVQPPTVLEVNGQRREVQVAPTTPLMYVLRNDLGLKGVRTGCAIGECGACRVLLDGRSVQSCITPVSEATGAAITTPEGLGGPDDPHPVQQAFLDEQAAQCGYCINGIIMTVAGEVENNPGVDDARLREAIDEHLCRCGTHLRILRAATRAAGRPAPPPAHEIVTDRDDHDRPRSPIPEVVRDDSQILRWLELGDDGRVIAYPGKVELGQGLRTALAQVVAAQLGLPIERVRVAATVTGRSPDQGQTAGSLSLEEAGVALGMAARALHRVLTGRAARLLNASPANVQLDPGGAVLAESGRRVSYADLLAVGPITEQIDVEQDHPRWDAPPLGAPLSRDDLRPKLTGAPAYVHDIALPGMVHARILLPPDDQAEPQGLDLDAVRAMPGVRKVLEYGRTVLVIAEREEQAIRAHNRLAGQVRWEKTRSIVQRDVEQLLRESPARPYVRRRDPDVDRCLAGGNTHDATYVRPYQAHGPMAPSAAVAFDDGGVLQVWTHSQGVYPLRRELAALLAIDEDRLVVQHVDGPGCYGMTGADDAAAFAAIAACAVRGTPVRLQFPMTDEFIWDPHGPAMVADLRASLQEDGTISALRFRALTDAHNTRPDGTGDRLMAAWLGPHPQPRPWIGLGEPGLRNALPLYDIPALEIVADEVRGPLRTGPLRSLGAFFNVFAIESFMDELAELAGQDPLAFRLAHLRDARAATVLRLAAERAGYQPHVGPSGRGLGLAFARYKDTKGYAAHAAEVDVDVETGAFRIVRIIVAADAGAVVNADGLRHQIEGGALQGVSRSLSEELHLSDSGVREQDWTTYQPLRFRDVPPVEVILVDRPGAAPLGAGEIATPPVPAAIANALDDAIGVRLRTLPLTPERLQQRLLTMSEAEMARVRLG